MKLYCLNCGSADHATCGAKTVTKTLPSPLTALVPPVPPETKRVVYKDQPRAAKAINVTVYYNRPFFEWVTKDLEVEFPRNTNRYYGVQLMSEYISIGRSDETQNWFPDVDIAALTCDTAVSIEHASLRILSNGDVTVTDLGSKNGTYLGRYAQDPLAPGQEVLLRPGVSLYIGAWTELVFHPS